MDPVILELMASRICHDLISPVGAVHNGVEFLQETGVEGGNEAIDLISHSAETAAARLQAFRLAYGAGGRDPNIKPEDVHRSFGNLIRLDGKVTQSWDPRGDLGYADAPLGFAKILMGVLMLAQECLPKGGDITVTPSARTNVTKITAASENAVLRDGVDKAVARSIPAEELDPRLVHPFVLSTLADHYGFALTIASAGSGKVEFEIGAK
jgi:histidine phosphotransferase ChpT